MLYLKNHLFDHLGLTLVFIYTLSSLLVTTQSVHAQLLPIDTSTNGQQDSSTAWPDDSLGRRTPRGTVEGFIRAVAKSDYKKASLYLQLNASLQKKQNGAKLAQAMQGLLD